MMHGLILAAGRGSRMGELTAELPKCFARLHGRRLLDWQLAALRGAGLDSLAIVRGYQADAFDEPVTFFENPRWAETNMVQTLLAADAWLSAAPCIVSYSDIFYSAETVKVLADCPADMAISFDPEWLDLWSQRFENPLLDAESFRRAESGTLLEIGERCTSVEEIQGQYMGLLKFTPTGWSKVKALLVTLDGTLRDRLDMTSLLKRGIAAGWDIGTVPVVGPWGEVDEASDLALYHRLISPELLC